MPDPNPSAPDGIPPVHAPTSASDRPTSSLAMISLVAGLCGLSVVPLVGSIAPSRIARWAGSRGVLWTAFGAVHAWLAFVGVVLLPLRAFGDVDLYRYWAATGLDTGFWPVLDGPWVYPVGALVPMLVPATVSTTSTTAYALAWSALVTALDAVAIGALLRRGGTGAWWWLAFLALLGPVAMGRIDAIVAPMVIVALLVAAQRPRLAAALVTAGAWIKVAPGVLVLPLAMVARRPVRDVIVPAALVCGGVVGAVAAGGGLKYVTSFLFAQGTRGLQIESVAASPWVVAALVRDDVTRVFNPKLITWEIVGPGTAGAARVLDVLLPLAVEILALLLWHARRRPSDVLVWGALALAALLIVFNKVGSPQFYGWLAPPVAVALARRAGPDGAHPALLGRVAVVVLVIAALTQIVFPGAYMSLLTGNGLVTAALVTRNVAVLALLIGACTALARGPRPAAGADVSAAGADVSAAGA